LSTLAGSRGRPAPRPEAGLRLEAAGGAWALVRLSATEPVLRITVEARDEERAQALHAELHAQVVEARAS
jgi:phosphoglucosamine mutase